MLAYLRSIPAYFGRPIRLFRAYRPADLQADLVAGLTVGVVLLPQAVVFALLAGVPPERGLYVAFIASIVGALWGSSAHLQTGPTNTASLLTFSTIVTLAAPGTPEFLAAAALLAVLVGCFRLILGLARMGLLVNFVSDSVVVGFTAGVGVLIGAGELRSLMRLPAPDSATLFATLRNVVEHIGTIHLPSLFFGLATILLLQGLRRINKRIPGSLITVALSAIAVWLAGNARLEVVTVGTLPHSLPPFRLPPLFDLNLIGHLSTGALAIAAIGLVEASSIARSIAAQSGQRLDSNQEFVGQGMANIISGFFSGYPTSASFNRSGLAYESGARTSVAAIISGLFVPAAMFILAPTAAFVPRATLSGMLIVSASAMIDWRELGRIWRSSRADGVIMFATLGATLFFPLQFAVLSGILMSFGFYMLETSAPQVRSVVPDDSFRHLVYRPDRPVCPQLAIIDIRGDLYFGAVGHIEEVLDRLASANPSQRFVLLRLGSVDHCDISGVYLLEYLLRTCRERGGDLFLVDVRDSVAEFLRGAGFEAHIGIDHILLEEIAIEHIFYHALDPTLCIYECPVRVFRECQNLPRPDYPLTAPLISEFSFEPIPTIAPQQLWKQLRAPNPPLVIDVREPREWRKGHLPQARHIPLAQILMDTHDLPPDRALVLVCRAGRRSLRAARTLRARGFTELAIVQGGMQRWEDEHLLLAVEVKI